MNTTQKIAILVFSLLITSSVSAAIRRDPNGVNVNSQNATTVFITFGGLDNQVPVEAFWCGELISAAPDIGQRCAPGTIFGRLPLRYDQSRINGGTFTDIMSIPQTVARRAYQAAANGETSAFFYVRRFVSIAGGRDEFVFVTCRMAGAGARTPFSLTDVKVQFEIDSPLLPVRPGQAPPPLFADIRYNGTGRLRGRWEVVVPGNEVPSAEDLLTEASLPVEQRGRQRRYTTLERFNVFLPPTGTLRLEGPDPSKLPNGIEGMYLVLLRVEASDDKEADSNLALAGAGNGIVHSGAVAGFPMPVLRYYVGNAGDVFAPGGEPPVTLLSPVAGARVDAAELPVFRWQERGPAPFYRLDVRDAAGSVILSAVVERGAGHYTVPSWFHEKAGSGRLLWRVSALSTEAEVLGGSAWRDLHAAVAPSSK
jgi:hypothetical protein